ncbi:LRP2 protein, partial [Pseudoatta argentina]
MENQGYEEDQSRAAQEQSTLESRRRDQQLCTDTIDVIDNPVVARATSHPESNLYEDIAIGAGINTCELSKRTFYSDESRNLPETGGLLARQAWINRPSSSTIDRPFQQNSTLSSRISTKHDSIITLFRTSEDDAEKVFEKSRELPVPSLSEDVSENVSLSLQANEDSSQDVSVTQFDRRLNRRRRKKDCKHCRSKLADVSSCEKFDELIDSKDTILKENGDNHRDRHPDASTLLFRESLLRSQNIKVYPIVSRTSLRDIGAKRSSSAAFPASEYGVHRTENAARFLLNMENDKMLGQVVEGAQNKILGVSGNGTDMRINSIYSQDRWYNKESQIFYTDVKDQNPFQRAYSLPARTHTPTSQNRANLRRSVRNESPPQPARLDKHRRGWTLHLARPLKASGCSSPLIPLLIVVLILLGVAGVALYIVFEPEKLQIIQQYLKSSMSRLTGQNVTSGEPIMPTNDESNLTTAMTDTMTLTSMTDIEETFAGGMFAMSAPISGNLSFPGSTSPSNEGLETEAASQSVINATRYCDDCFEGELCVAIFGEMVPICRKIRDHNDPTGCGGFCTLNRQKCHRLDVDAFRCERVERFFCLENEWTCSNTLCIPLDKRCDGHMNCYDHSDEFDCVCNLKTHFQCGNKTSCLPLERRCDRKIDCWDATDEINCTLVCSLEDEFTCINGECIQRDRFCDGLADCSDGTDEPHGCQGRCNKHEFTCQNSRCIAKRMKCNGFDDCGDSSDEVHCKDRFI